MESIHRLSMNTSLKNARIFDDDAWDDSGEFPVRKIKVENPDLGDDTQQQPSLSCVAQNECKLEIPIKEESNCDEITIEELEDAVEFPVRKIKLETSDRGDDIQQQPCVKQNECKLKIPIKQESDWDDITDNYNLVNKNFQKCSTIKTNPSSPSQIKSKENWTKINKPQTPPPPHISDDPFYKIKLERNAAQPSDSMFDHSPYNKELLKSWRIGETTPVKTEEDSDGPSSSYITKSFKSAKKTVFNRPSPYDTGVGSTDTTDLRLTLQNKQGIKRKSDKGDCVRSKHKTSNMETDPLCLARREKQIEYGKNTAGYENYLKLVPKSERKPEDPQTPPKYKKYSRRGWEGLIKQWRIKLHQYDPPETPDS